MYRVIIADDEEIIRNGVVQLIDWAKLECVVVRECASGSEVLTYLEDHEADILITDVKMPEIDGIRLLEKIHEKNLNISVVLLTAYSDFSSAQSAIRYGAVDYVVKNDFIEDLPRAIGLAKEEAERRKRENQKPEGFNEADVAGYILETLALSKMLSRSSDIAKYGLNRYDYCVCSCEILDFAHAPVTDKNVQMLKNFMNTIVNRHKYYIVNIRPDSLTLIICEEKDAGLCAEEIAVMCNEILRIVDEFMRVNLKFGVSTVVRDVEQLGAAYNESVQALARCASRGNEVIFYVEESGMGITEDINSYIPKITDCLFQKDLLEAERHLEEMKEVVAQGGYPFEKLKIRAYNLSSSIFRKFGESYIGDVLGDLEDYTYKRLTSATTIYSLFEILRELLGQIDTNLKANKYEKNYLIMQIDNFIQGNYQKNIALKDIADAVHVSPAYVSRLYRNKCGVTVTDAIIRTRMEQSKKLLRQTSYKIYEIAELVGVEDPAYFTNVFTKYVGCNPSEYRNQK